ncbi:class F sortase [Saccharomonospora sp. NPDC006951]
MRRNSSRSRVRGNRSGRGTIATFLALVAVVLSGCSAEQPDGPGSPSPAPASPAANTPPVTALPRSAPEWVDVPGIGAHSSLVPLGLNPDRTVTVPPVDEPMQAGWYQYSPTPGETGPAVILGHVDGGGEDGIFARLHELDAGDEIRVGRSDGSVARFVVERMAREPKSAFPSDEVYGDTEGPELRLITCGGVFDAAEGSYRDNIIAFATFAGAD